MKRTKDTHSHSMGASCAASLHWLTGAASPTPTQPTGTATHKASSVKRTRVNHGQTTCAGDGRISADLRGSAGADPSDPSPVSLHSNPGQRVCCGCPESRARRSRQDLRWKRSSSDREPQFIILIPVSPGSRCSLVVVLMHVTGFGSVSQDFTTHTGCF